MQKLFVDFIPDGEVTLDEEQSRHIARSLRMRVGDMLTLSSQDGFDYGCRIERIDSKNVTLCVCYQQANNSEPTVSVRLYQGVPKSDKLEDVIQKCTEVGISKITPVLTKRSVSRPDEKSAKKKLARYQKIALEASQQSGRGIIPQVCEMTTLSSALLNDDSELKIIFYEGGGQALKELITPEVKSVSIYIGAEGGFDTDEVEAVKNAGGRVATLGKRILRTQTAPVVATTAIMLLTDNM
jgi:16S rRNA (uracil1498-N3)-methyltransferase